MEKVVWLRSGNLFLCEGARRVPNEAFGTLCNLPFGRLFGRVGGALALFYAIIGVFRHIFCLV